MNLFDRFKKNKTKETLEIENLKYRNFARDIYNLMNTKSMDNVKELLKDSYGKELADMWSKYGDENDANFQFFTIAKRTYQKNMTKDEAKRILDKTKSLSAKDSELYDFYYDHCCLALLNELRMLVI